MRKLIFAALILAAPLAVACNTVEGAGKDIEQGGKAIKNEANENKN